MSWASRRRGLYVGGIVLFFAVLLGIPAAIFLHEPATCFDKKQNQGETAPDKGGPCALLDERALSPTAILWARSFLARAGSYNAVAYLENPNKDAGVSLVSYRFGLYDERNVLVAEREGAAFVMPSGITPVFAGAIGTGNRAAVRTYFELTEEPVWIRAQDVADAIQVTNKNLVDVQSAPRLTAKVKNTSVSVIIEPAFVAVIFDTAGNAIAASATTVPRLSAGEEGEIIFTWVRPFEQQIGRIDVIPLVEPKFAGE